MKKAACLVLAGIQVLIVVGAWLWIHTHHPLGNLLTGEVEGQALAWGRLAGLLAALAVLAQLALIGRVRWVEQSFGFDRLTRLHHVLGFALLALVILHPLLLAFGHARQADVGFLEQVADFCGTWRGVLTATIGAGLMLASSAFSVLVLLKRMRYELWYATHLVLYVAFGLTVLHQVAVGSDFTDHLPFKVYWLALYAFVFANLLGNRFVRPLLVFARQRFRVVDVVSEAGDVTSVIIGGAHLDAFRVEAGQFLIVRFLAPGFRWEAHPFSVSCFPDGRSLRLSIKHVGDFTRRIPELKPGTTVLVDGPHGVFTSRRCASDKVLLIAGGIGITPIRALAEEMVNSGRNVVLLYGNRLMSGVVFKDEFDALAVASGGLLRVTYVLSSEPGWGGEKGYIDSERLVRLAPDLKERDIYLCGPQAMMKGVRSALRELGASSSRLHDERFSL